MIKNYNRIYFLGIGGIGMSSLAFYFINENKYVAGYDKVNSDITKSLSKNGAKIHFTDNYLSIPSQFLNQSETLVVYTPAISKFNKEQKGKAQLREDKEQTRPKRYKIISIL